MGRKREGERRRGRLSMVLILVASIWVANAEAVSGQENATPNMRLAFGPIVGGGLPDAYFAPECSDGGAAGAFFSAARQVHQWVALSVDAQYVRDIGVGNCAYAHGGILPELPEPYTSAETRSEGPSVWAPMVSALIGAASQEGPVVARGVLRVGFRKGLSTESVVSLGAQLEFPVGGERRIVFGLERWMTDVSVERILRREEAGQVVLEDRHTTTTSGGFTGIRVGVSFPIG